MGVRVIEGVKLSVEVVRALPSTRRVPGFYVFLGEPEARSLAAELLVATAADEVPLLVASRVAALLLCAGVAGETFSGASLAAGMLTATAACPGCAEPC